MIVVNFKTYKEATGDRAIGLAQICKKVTEETRVRIVAVPQLVDVKDCVAAGAECWVQHVDEIDQGQGTGWVTAEGCEEAGAKGTLLNHSEHRLDGEKLQKTAGILEPRLFEVCICAADVEEVKKVAAFGPEFILYEPPELVGSRDKSVATEKPEVIEQVVKAVNVPILVGAGVKSPEDVKVAIKLGAIGIGVASGVVLAEDWEKALRELAEAFNA